VFNGNGLVSRDLGLTAGILFLRSPLTVKRLILSQGKDFNFSGT
jgi:hypothetical protein